MTDIPESKRPLSSPTGPDIELSQEKMSEFRAIGFELGADLSDRKTGSHERCESVVAATPGGWPMQAARLFDRSHLSVSLWREISIYAVGR